MPKTKCAAALCSTISARAVMKKKISIELMNELIEHDFIPLTCSSPLAVNKNQMQTTGQVLTLLKLHFPTEDFNLSGPQNSCFWHVNVVSLRAKAITLICSRNVYYYKALL